jgi:hypothetical protein
VFTLLGCHFSVRVQVRVRFVRAIATEAFTWRADYRGGRSASPSREHAPGTSQLTELAASGRQVRAQRLPAPQSEARDVNGSVAMISDLPQNPARCRVAPTEAANYDVLS